MPVGVAVKKRVGTALFLGYNLEKRRSAGKHWINFSYWFSKENKALQTPFSCPGIRVLKASNDFSFTSLQLYRLSSAFSFITLPYGFNRGCTSSSRNLCTCWDARPVKEEGSSRCSSWECMGLK